MKTSGVTRIITCIILLFSGSLISSAVFAQWHQKLPAGSVENNELTGSDPRRARLARDVHQSLNDFLIAPFVSATSDQPVSDSMADVGNTTTDDDEFRNTYFKYPTNSKKDVGLPDFSTDLVLIYARALKEYARKNGFDTSYAFLSNMGMLCNKKRFFVVNLVTMKVEQSGLVSHGRGQGVSMYDKQYSDEPGSRCTSLGRYKILGKYRGNYGAAYRVAGLDSSNQHALDRNIVLHSMNCIPDVENLFPACVSDGCPAVSGKFLSSIGAIIDSRQKPMLLWIFDSNLQQPVVREKHSTSVSTGMIKVIRNNYVIRGSYRQFRLDAAIKKPIHSQNKFLQWMREEKYRIFHSSLFRPLAQVKTECPKINVQSLVW